MTRENALPLVLLLAFSPACCAHLFAPTSGLYDIKLKPLIPPDGAPNTEHSLAKYRGDVLLIANIASKCGRTQKGYQQLNELHRRYQKNGLMILGIPCNQFGSQEPGAPDAIKSFAVANDAHWFISEKIDVNGPHSHPLYQFLKGDAFECTDADAAYCEARDATGACNNDYLEMLHQCPKTCDMCHKFLGDIAWNFEYFLVSRRGRVVARLPSGADLLHADTLALIDSELDEPNGVDGNWTSDDIGVPVSILFLVLFGCAVAIRGNSRDEKEIVRRPSIPVLVDNDNGHRSHDPPKSISHSSTHQRKHKKKK
eukprot:m.249012 g.249012  ORF g.249012 m.249012 type:complete len:312 (+) comp19511_c0_seq1:161-1096(+)